MRFGLREISRKGKQVLLNGRPIFLRGGCDDQLYPESFCPPNSKEFFLKRIKLAKEYGFNYTKSCVEVFTPGIPGRRRRGRLPRLRGDAVRIGSETQHPLQPAAGVSKPCIARSWPTSSNRTAITPRS